MKVIGWRFFDYTSKKTGKTSPACNLYVTYPGNPERGFTGDQCEAIFLYSDSLGSYSPQIGDEINVYYNRFGRVTSIDYAD